MCCFALPLHDCVLWREEEEEEEEGINMF